MIFESAGERQNWDFKPVALGGHHTVRDERVPTPFSFVFCPHQGMYELNLIVAVAHGRTMDFLAKPEQVIDTDNVVR